MRLHKITKACVGGALMACAGLVHAAPTYCAAYMPAANPDGLTTSDMMYSSANANDCYGVVTAVPDNSPATISAIVNGISNWGGGWTFLAKDEDNTTAGTGSFMGLNFTLQANNIGLTGGSWTLTASDANGGAPLNLPVPLDFVGVLKASNRLAAYFFDDVVVQAGANGGSWTISYKNKGNQTPSLSHLDLLVRVGSTNVPEPGIVSLLGIGLLGVAAARRRRNKAVNN